MKKAQTFYDIIDKHTVSETEAGKAIIINHDQLNLSFFPKDLVKEKPVLVFIESFEKGTSRLYHKKKLIFLLSSMRHAALKAVGAGFKVIYWRTTSHYDQALISLINRFKNLRFTAMEAAEWDTRLRFKKVADDSSGRLTIIPNSFFLANPEEWKEKVQKGYRMEFFYREMRKRTGFLMNTDGKPEGGDWNYDKANRKKLPKNYRTPKKIVFEADEITQEVIQFVDDQFSSHFGQSKGFGYAVTKEQAQDVLHDFINNRLHNFGAYEDAMATNEDEINHSVLSLYINNGLLSVMQVCEAVLQAYRNDSTIPIESVEGFIRQVIGWREFIRVYYEVLMPDIHQKNALDLKESLPLSFWEANSGLHCVDESVRNVKENGYAHHIQRLMVLSNFANLTRTNPFELNEWFWYGFVDAYDWVTTPNVIGMSTFADGGLLASKPYVSSGSYINKMSNYCSSCKFKVKDKLGKDACPFNYLYWQFVADYEQVFSQNGRVGFMVNTYHKKSAEEKAQIQESASDFINNLKRY
jgi:deoxyribodipyrimidine photolyase-related protein